MKKTFFILALLAVVLQTTATGFVYLRFQLNRDYIAKNLCVKKEEKNNCCQGSCQLKKELNEEEKKEKTPAAPNFKTKNHFQLFCQQQEHYTVASPLMSGQVSTSYSFTQKTASLTAVFHPPC